MPDMVSCLEGVQKVSGKYLEDVWKDSGSCLEVIWRSGSESVQVYKCASAKVCKFVNMQVCMHAMCKYCKCTQICLSKVF